MQDYAYDECMEFMEFMGDWLNSIPKEVGKDLEARVHKVLEEWADAHGLQPAFYLVEDIVEHTVTQDEIDNIERATLIDELLS